MGVRRKGRELAVQALYRMELTGDGSAAGWEDLWEHFETTREARRFAAELVVGVVENREAIDALVARALEHWSVGRLSRVDLNVLRVGVHELLHPGEVPTAVVLDEAIEVARRFGGHEAAQFVNGVLDRVAELLGVRDQGRVTAKGAHG
jgi:transcription antitermination protein NusB